jgi:hypothetical protein
MYASSSRGVVFKYAHAHNRSVSELLAEMIERTVSDNIIEATDEQGEQS